MPVPDRYTVGFLAARGLTAHVSDSLGDADLCDRGKLLLQIGCSDGRDSQGGALALPTTLEMDRLRWLAPLLMAFA